MYSSKITVQVKRKKKAGAGLFKGLMVFFGVLFVLMGIMFSRGFMLSGFLLVVLYFIFDTFSKKEYEYTLDGMELRISVIWGGHYRQAGGPCTEPAGDGGGSAELARERGALSEKRRYGEIT